MAKRPYVVDLPGGTFTTPVQLQTSGKLTRVTVSYLSTAAGKIEISRSITSQIGTAAPTKDVLARLNCSATAGNVVAYCEIDGNNDFGQLDYVYFHQTGAGNLGDVNFYL